jgi:flagellar basal-body rod modification protein FlgD
MISPVTSMANASTTSSANTTASSSATKATVNYNQFLQLLISEMQNQDPTNPMDPTQTVSQLATFSSVEQQVQTNKTLDNLMVGLKLPNT